MGFQNGHDSPRAAHAKSGAGLAFQFDSGKHATGQPGGGEQYRHIVLRPTGQGGSAGAGQGMQIQQLAVVDGQPFALRGSGSAAQRRSQGRETPDHHWLALIDGGSSATAGLIAIAAGADAVAQHHGRRQRRPIDTVAGILQQGLGIDDRRGPVAGYPGVAGGFAGHLHGGAIQGQHAQHGDHRHHQPDHQADQGRPPVRVAAHHVAILMVPPRSGRRRKCIRRYAPPGAHRAR